jgi:hypothetical protein
VIDLAAIPLAAIRVSTRRPPGKAVPSLAKPLAVSAGGTVLGLVALRRVLQQLSK